MRGPGLCLCALLLAGPARADRSFDVARLLPAVDSYGLVFTERALTPRRFEPGAALLVSYTHAPLRLVMSTADGRGAQSTDLVMGQAGLDLGLSLGLWDFLAVAALLPVAAPLHDLDAVGELYAVPRAGMPTVATGLYAGAPRQNVGLANAGPRDPRLSVKGRLPRWGPLGLALVLSLTVPLGNSASFLGEPGVTFRPLLVADLLLMQRLSLLFNMGAIVRGSSELHDPRTGTLLLQAGHELQLAVGAAYRAHRLVSASLELLGTVPLTVAGAAGPGLPGGAQQMAVLPLNFDLAGGASLYPAPGLRLFLGVAAGLVESSPTRGDVRGLLQVAWAPMGALP